MWATPAGQCVWTRHGRRGFGHLPARGHLPERAAPLAPPCEARTPYAGHSGTRPHGMEGVVGLQEIAVTLGVIAFVGEHHKDSGYDREGGQEQPLEKKRVVDVGRDGGAGHRKAVSIHRDVLLGAPLGPVGRVGAGDVAAALGPHGACVEDQVWVASQRSWPTWRRGSACARPACCSGPAVPPRSRRRLRRARRGPKRPCGSSAPGRQADCAPVP